MPLDVRGGFETHWTRAGHGPRAALMIHCSLGHAGGWAGVTAKLDDMISALAYDLPGHGRSADWDARGDLQQVSMAMAADLLDDLVGGPADIIGHSFGGTVALRLAVERPDLVRSLTLIEPVFFAVGLHDRPDLAPRYATQMQGYTEALAAGDRTAAARAFTSVWGDGRVWERLPEGQRQALAQRIHLIEAGAPAILGDGAGMLASGALERITVPVLLIEGGASPEYIDAINTGLARRIPDTERAVVEGAGHMAPLTHAAAVAGHLRRFLERVPAG